jgi:hypothetical protein
VVHDPVFFLHIVQFQNTSRRKPRELRRYPNMKWLKFQQSDPLYTRWSELVPSFLDGPMTWLTSKEIDVAVPFVDYDRAITGFKSTRRLNSNVNQLRITLRASKLSDIQIDAIIQACVRCSDHTLDVQRHHLQPIRRLARTKSIMTQASTATPRWIDKVTSSLLGSLVSTIKPRLNF